MKIEVKDKDDCTYKFGTIRNGVVFCYNGAYMMKLDTIEPWNAVNLHTGSLFAFSDLDLVRVEFDAVLTICRRPKD